MAAETVPIATDTATTGKGSGAALRLFGAAALTSGVVTLVWHDHRPVSLSALAAAQIIGGAAIQVRRSAKAGTVVLGVVYLVFAALCVPRVIAAPQIYNGWGNFFEPFSLATGAAIAYASVSPGRSLEAMRRTGRVVFGLCVASFCLEQAFYLDNTASLVPTWIPPSPMFWAVATTVFFALAAVALLANVRALLASRLLTLMLVLFGLLVWVPLLIANPHSYANWSEFAETFAIAGAAWMLTDLLGVADRSFLAQAQ